MALIKCPECGKEISELATQCPHCGCPSSKWQKIEDEKASHIDLPVNLPNDSIDEQTIVHKSNKERNKGILIVVSIPVIVMLLGIVCFSLFSLHKEEEINPPIAVVTENFHDNSPEHQKYAFSLFKSNLFGSQDYLSKHGTVKEYTSNFNPIKSSYEVCVSFDIVRMNEHRVEIYSGDVHMSKDGKDICYSDPIRVNSMKFDNTGVVGRWKISNRYFNEPYELIIRKEGSTYYAYEFGKKKKLSKKEDKYFEVGNKAGEYYHISNNGLRMCDKDGDFTYESGYIITRL